MIAEYVTLKRLKAKKLTLISVLLNYNSNKGKILMMRVNKSGFLPASYLNFEPSGRTHTSKQHKFDWLIGNILLR
jgi:hypothetical protein